MSLRDVLTPDQRVDEIVRVAVTTDERLDDITRAKIWTRLEDRIDDNRPARWRWLLPVAAAAAVVAALILATRRAPRPDAEAWVARRGSTLSLNAGPHARAALVGPAQLDMIDVGETTTVALRSGTLLAEFEGGPGRSLRIEAPGARIEIVGTLFSIDVSGKTTCVSVAHGRVRMTTFARVIEIGAGEGACSDEIELHPMPEGVREALARHAAVLAAAQPTNPNPNPNPTPNPSPSPSPSPSPNPNPNPNPSLSPSPSPTLSPNPSPIPTPRQSPTPISTPIPTRNPIPTPGRSPTRTPTRITTSGSTSAPPAPTPPTSKLAPVEPAPAKPPPARADSVLYREAEAAIAKRDLAAADRALAKLVELPDTVLLDQALYERGRIAFQQHAWTDARLTSIASRP